MGKNAIVGQSGGPTSVINASLAGANPLESFIAYLSSISNPFY